MRGKDSIKQKRYPKRKGSELRKKHCSNQNYIYNQLQVIYTRTDLLGLCRGRFSLGKTSLLLLYCHLDPLQLLPGSLEPSFPTHSLQIYCIGLFRPKSFYHLCLGLKLHPYINIEGVKYEFYTTSLQNLISYIYI